MIWSGAAAYGMIAAMLSGILRRPKRLLITLTSLFPSSVVLCSGAILLLRFGGFSTGFAESPASYIGVFALPLAINPLVAGLIWGYELETALSPDMPPLGRALGIQWQTGLFYLIVAAVSGAVVVGVASARSRRTSSNRKAWNQDE